MTILPPRWEGEGSGRYNKEKAERLIIEYIWQVLPSHNISLLQDVFLPILVASVPVSSETLRFERYRDRDLSRPQNFQVVETETQRDSRIWRMSRPRLIETKKFGGCQDRDSSRLKNLEDIETETHRDSPKGVETETETKSLATHWGSLAAFSDFAGSRALQAMRECPPSAARLVFVLVVTWALFSQCF